MKSCNQGHYESIKKALKGVGLKVDEILKQDKKTVITVLRYKASEKGAMTPRQQITTLRG